MVEISTTGDALHLEVKGWDKLWAFKSRLEIPLSHVKSAHAHPAAARDWWKGLRAPGTYLPGVITAGTYYRHGKRVFWDVHDPEKTIVIRLADDRYDELIVEVNDPAASISQVNRAIGARDAPDVSEGHGPSSVDLPTGP